MRPVDEYGVAVAAANDDVGRGHDDLFEVGAGFDQDEVTGLRDIYGVLNRCGVVGNPDRVDLRSGQRCYWWLDDLAVGRRAVEDRRSADLVTISSSASRAFGSNGPL